MDIDEDLIYADLLKDDAKAKNSWMDAILERDNIIHECNETIRSQNVWIEEVKEEIINLKALVSKEKAQNKKLMEDLRKMREESNKWWNSFSKMKRLTSFLKGMIYLLDVDEEYIEQRKHIVDGKNVAGHVSKDKLDQVYKEYLKSENDYFMDKRPPKPVVEYELDEDGNPILDEDGNPIPIPTPEVAEGDEPENKDTDDKA